tara:strand:- start:315 stop:494 length:180 start_codon:yes stop_codon:yes gene_type:complete
MLCVLVFVGFNHAFVTGAGSVLFKYCYYDCNNASKNGGWYDRVYRVTPFANCPKEFVLT